MHISILSNQKKSDIYPKFIGYIQNLLAEIGLEPQRIKMYNMSAAMAGEFVAKAKEMTEIIQPLGLIHYETIQNDWR